MTPLLHALHQRHRYGGSLDALVAVHAFLDASKASYADPRHRAVLHHVEGARLCAELVRAELPRPAVELALEHIREDLGYEAVAESWTCFLRKQPWMTAHHATPERLAQGSARHFGGEPETYLPVHRFLHGGERVLTEATRLRFFHTLGVEFAVARFGEAVPGSRFVPTRLVAEFHITRLTDGRLPSVSDWCSRISLERWMLRDQSAHQAVVEITRGALAIAA